MRGIDDSDVPVAVPHGVAHTATGAGSKAEYVCLQVHHCQWGCRPVASLELVEQQGVIMLLAHSRRGGIGATACGVRANAAALHHPRLTGALHKYTQVHTHTHTHTHTVAHGP